MMKTVSLALLFILAFTAGTAAQDTTWHSPHSIEGICVRDTAHIFYRLPTELKSQVRSYVWELGRNTAGEFVHFRSSARSLTVRYRISEKYTAFPHMPGTGVSGLDLYIKDADGRWNWSPGSYRIGDTCQYIYKNILVKSGEAADFYLYLPLYNTVEWLTIGTKSGESFEFTPDQRGKPIVAYGTSILQGACASRPGLAWTNILSRSLNKTVINLGFSGNGRYEQPIFDHIAKVDAALYILDCIPNLVDEILKSPDSVESRIRYGVSVLRKAHPSVPILFTEYPNGDIPLYTDSTLLRTRHDANLFMERVFKKLQTEGVAKLYLLTEKEIGFDINSLTETTHPTDIGMLQYAKAYEKKIATILR